MNAETLWLNVKIRSVELVDILCKVAFASRRCNTVVYTPGFSFDMAGFSSLVLYNTVLLVLTPILLPAGAIRAILLPAGAITAILLPRGNNKKKSNKKQHNS
jgi:hypothetical protein